MPRSTLDCRYPHPYDPDHCDLDLAQHEAESARRETNMAERDQGRRALHAAAEAEQLGAASKKKGEK